MESGLDGRNNVVGRDSSKIRHLVVSMESGLDGRNNRIMGLSSSRRSTSLNGVRPRWPEQ